MQSFFKKALLFIILISNKDCVFSQSTDPLIHKFHISIISYISYPDSLIKAKIPVVTVLKITINAIGGVVSMDLSDSAEPSYYKKFSDNKKFLNINAIQAFVKRERLRNTTLLIPIRLYMNLNNVVSMKLLNQQLTFKERAFTGKVIILPPLDDVFATKTDY